MVYARFMPIIVCHYNYNRRGFSLSFPAIIVMKTKGEGRGAKGWVSLRLTLLF